MANLKNTIINSSGFLQFPVGTTAQRPASPEAGMMRVNTDRSNNPVLEFYDGTEWLVFGGYEPISATGGDIDTFVDSADGKTYRTHVFKSSSSFDVNSTGSTDGEVEYLIVAGGASTGSDDAGGGGAGGLITGTFSVNTQVYGIAVGSGGTPRNGGNAGVAQNGTDSSAFSITATGGGYGGNQGQPGGSGGSGGGGGHFPSSGGAGISGQGNPGGRGFTSPGGAWSAGGGGGAGEAGFDANNSNPNQSRGGDGLSTNIINTTIANNRSVGQVISSSVFFAGGGGGQYRQANPPGGDGGGGAGSGDTSPGFSAIANTGGGGGGGGNNSTTNLGGSGGSGAVIIRYPITR